MENEILTPEENAGQHIGRDLISAMVDEFKAMPDSWEKLNKQQQDDVLFRLKRRVTSEVSEAVRIIASKSRPELLAHVKKVVFSDGGVEAQLSVSKKDAGRHDLADSQGESVLIVITNPDEYTQTMSEIQGESNQKTMF